jgi:hypothetical protein
MFTVVGALEVSPGVMRVDIMNHDNVVEEFVVPTEQYQKCYPRRTYFLSKK